MQWYVTEAVEREAQRLDLSLGLRNSVWFYNNAPCPGIGSVNHPRLYTHSVLGIYIAKKLNLSAITITNAIEALSLKLTYNANNGENYNHRGSRAFGRDQDNLSYNFLKLAKNYVTITYRQNTSRYLTNTFGIGLVNKGSRYSNYELANSGLEIVSELNTGSDHYEKLLSEWVLGNSLSSRGRSWLEMSKIQQVEKRIFLERFRSSLGSDSFFFNLKDLRKNIFEYFINKGSEAEIQGHLAGEEMNIYAASLKFLEIKELLNVEIRRAGQELEEHFYNSITANSLSKDIVKLIQKKITEHNNLLAKLDLTSHQRAYVSDSQLLFKELLKEDDRVRFLCILLDRAKDFFVVEDNGKYKRAVTYTKENFQGSLESELEIHPYAVKNLKSQLEILL